MSLPKPVPPVRPTCAQSTLDETSVAPDPFDQFRVWFDEALASGVLVEPYAMTLATVGVAQAPSARIVLLRGYDRRGFAFYTNYESRKGRELAAVPNGTPPKAALLLYWDALQRQIRIEGAVARVAEAESDAYFAQRPRGHRLGAWASAQSRPVPDRAFLETRLRAERERFGDADIPRPPYWGGYRVTPHAFEFWQHRTDRMHDRIVYLQAPEGWRIERLAP